MAENSAIEWTHHTFNPWRGCSKVSPGCAHCYAETMSKRNPATLGTWGDDGTRVVAAESYWRQPLKWDRQAALAYRSWQQAIAEARSEYDRVDAYVRPRVFCASLADVFEDWPGQMRDAHGFHLWQRDSGQWTTSDHYRDTRALTLADVRARLFRLIVGTPNLDWLLLTKRSENLSRMLPWGKDRPPEPRCRDCADDGPICPGNGLPCDRTAPLPNVWLGVSVEDQRRKARIDVLRQIPAAVRFLSVEPLLEDIGTLDLSGIHWVIVGGESGPGARPCDLAWLRSVVAQCRAGVPCFVKQLGARPVCNRAIVLEEGESVDDIVPQHSFATGKAPLRDKKGGDPAEWPDDLRVREFPAVACGT
jgi:protein gp37